MSDDRVLTLRQFLDEYTADLTDEEYTRRLDSGLYDDLIRTWLWDCDPFGSKSHGLN